MVCKWSKKARRERCLAVLHGLGFAGATQQPQRQRQHGQVALPEALQLSDEEKGVLRDALDGPLYVKSNPGISKPILLRLNEFILKRSDCDYVQYEACAAPCAASAAAAAAALLSCCACCRPAVD